MATEFPYMPLYVQDLISDPKVAVMSNECLGAYVRLLCYCWIDGYLPADEKRLAKMSNLGRRWGHHRIDLLRRFVQQKLHISPETDATNCATEMDVLTHKRLTAEREKLLQRRAKRRAAANVRWGNKDDASADAKQCLSLSSSLSLSNTPPHPPLVGGGSAEELELEEGRMMERYARSDLSVDELAVVKEVVDFVNTNLKTKKFIDVSKRVQHHKTLAKYPVLQVCKACHDFKRGECIEAHKRFNYLLGITRNSAGIWYREWMASQDKRRFDLG